MPRFQIDRRLPGCNPPREIRTRRPARQPPGCAARPALCRLRMLTQPTLRDSIHREADACREAPARAGVVIHNRLGGFVERSIKQAPKRRRANLFRRTSQARRERADDRRQLRAQEFGHQAGRPAQVGLGAIQQR